MQMVRTKKSNSVITLPKESTEVRTLKSKKGLTLVELMFVILLLSVVTYTVWKVFITGSRTATRLSKTVTLAQQARLCDTKLSRELRLGIEILSPLQQTSGFQSSPVLVMLNQTNELLVFYVNDKNQLIRQSRTRNNTETILGRNVSAFRVFRKGERLINYHLEMAVDDPKMPDGKRRFSLITAVTLRNPVN